MPEAARGKGSRRTRAFWILSIAAALLSPGGAGPVAVEYAPILVNADFSEKDFDGAVHATGRNARSLWPDDPEPDAGVKLMLVHLYESMSEEKRPRRRIFISEGQLWAE